MLRESKVNHEDKRRGILYVYVVAAILMIVGIVGWRGTLQVTAQEKSYMDVVGARIWPIQDTTLYDENHNEIMVIKAGTTLQIIEEKDGNFKVLYNEQAGYVDSAFCMINLPDVMQKDMEYDITNAYSSIYRINGRSITGVTGQTLYPYAKTGKDTYLVPLLYPVALKLYEAEEDALSRGYSLKVYDAYRPYEITKKIYAITSNFVEDNPKYLQYMTETVDGVTYGQRNFLAKSVSNHNYGVAVDITLVNLSTGEELSMQSNMHELSTASVLSRNNEEADLLSDIMLSSGFTGLISEWWHFEIRDYRQSYAAFQVSE